MCQLKGEREEGMDGLAKKNMVCYLQERKGKGLVMDGLIDEQDPCLVFSQRERCVCVCVLCACRIFRCP